MRLTCRAAQQNAEQIWKFLSQSTRFDGVLKDVKLISAGDGKCSCKLVVNHAHTNAGNTLHGGMTATMVDCISTMALLTTKPYSPGVSTDLSVSYMKAAKHGEEIAIDAKASKIGKTLAFLTVDITNCEGELIAQGKHTKFIGGSSETLKID